MSFHQDPCFTVSSWKNLIKDQLPTSPHEIQYFCASCPKGPLVTYLNFSAIPPQIHIAPSISRNIYEQKAIKNHFSLKIRIRKHQKTKAKKKKKTNWDSYVSAKILKKKTSILNKPKESNGGKKWYQLEKGGDFPSYLGGKGNLEHQNLASSQFSPATVYQYREERRGFSSELFPRVFDSAHRSRSPGPNPRICLCPFFDSGLSTRPKWHLKGPKGIFLVLQLQLAPLLQLLLRIHWLPFMPPSHPAKERDGEEIVSLVPMFYFPLFYYIHIVFMYYCTLG